jgi:hypothetical protein
MGFANCGDSLSMGVVLSSMEAEDSTYTNTIYKIIGGERVIAASALNIGLNLLLYSRASL